jgi:hypothetical protein
MPRRLTSKHTQLLTERIRQKKLLTETPSHPSVRASIRRLPQSHFCYHFKPASPSPAAPAPNSPMHPPIRASRAEPRHTQTGGPPPRCSVQAARTRPLPGIRWAHVAASEEPRSFVEASPEQSPREPVPIRDRNPWSRQRKPNKSPSSTQVRRRAHQ